MLMLSSETVLVFAAERRGSPSTTRAVILSYPWAEDKVPMLQIIGGVTHMYTNPDRCPACPDSTRGMSRSGLKLGRELNPRSVKAFW